MHDICQKGKRKKQHRAWTRRIRIIPNKLNLSLPMPKVIPTILTRFSDVWQTYKQIWYVPFIWSFTWYSYWIIFDSVVWNKPLAQFNLLNYIGATASAIFILVAPPIRRHLSKGVVFARTHVGKGTHIATALLGNQIRKRISGKRISHATLLREVEPSQVEKPKLQEQPQVLKPSHTVRTRRVTKLSQAKLRTQQVSSYASPVPPSFDCSCPNGMAGGLDQCLVCANLIDCAYRRKIMSGSEVREKSPASSLSAAEMPVEKVVAS